MPEKIITVYVLILYHQFDGSGVAQKYIDMLSRL